MAVVFMLMATTAGAAWKIEKQPLGWNGWAWGTPLSSIAAGLVYCGELDDVLPTPTGYKVQLFTLENELITYIGWEWEHLYVLVYEGKMCGILLQEARETDRYGRRITTQGSFAGWGYFSPNFASLSTEDLLEIGDMSIRHSKGIYASVMFISKIIDNIPDSPLFFNTNWIIGTPEVIDELIEAVYQNLTAAPAK